MAIIRRKIEAENITFNDDVLTYIADNIKSNIRERVQSYSWVGKNNFLTITYLGESVMRVEIQWVLSDSFPGGMAISFQDPGFSEDPLKCWIWSHGTDADEAEFDRFIEELRSRKVPIKQGK